MTKQRSDALVFFGASGDLAFKQIFPALQALAGRGQLEMPVIGVARSNLSDEQFKERAKNSINKNGKFVESDFQKLCSVLQYVEGDYNDDSTYSRLADKLKSAKNPLFYLAIPPDLFAKVAEHLAKAGLSKNARVVVEKPFGRDLESAKRLNETLHRFFAEENIFRIDHYLGKEPVQNLIYFRFANPFIHAAWNKTYIESVQITMAESFGVAGRGKFYEEAGAIRDVVQNHMLEVIACLAMECPGGPDHQARRNARGQLLAQVRSLSSDDVLKGQYDGYRSEDGVNPQSKVETFAALRFHVDNERWDGVPFFVRAGKCLPVTATEVLVKFKHSAKPVLDESKICGNSYFRFRLSPDTEIALGTKVKQAGELMTGRPVELLAHDESPDEMKPYDRLLGDAANGDASLFAREDAVEESWRIVDPVLKCDGDQPLIYKKNTWGPEEVASKLSPEGGWHNPIVEESTAKEAKRNGGANGDGAVPKEKANANPGR
jgi:glucose-6-phosphate 1-dehydrogenase